MIYKGQQVYLITINDITQKLKFEAELNLAEQLRQKDIIEAEENSRSQIGMELHDNVNQLLVASRLYLQRIQTSPDQSPYLVKTALDILGDALEEIRKLSATLVTPLLGNNNLKELIEDLLKNYALFNAAIELKIDIQENAIPQGLKTNIFRIIQEQISNITKYASATKINISLLQNDNYIDLNIADNGKGFNLKQPKKGIGLSNIMYRAKAYSGKFSIESEPNKGCKINIRFTLQQPKKDK
jgi:signal transduction histidine kinase